MPIVTGFFATLKVFASFFATFFTATYVQVAIVAYGVHSARQTAKKRRAAYEASLTDRTITLRSSESPFQEVYGATWISGPLLYACTSGPLRDEVSMVVAVASHQITAFDEFAIAGESVGPLDGSGYVTDGSRYYRRTEDVQAYFKNSLPAPSGTFDLPQVPAVIETFAAWVEITSEQQMEESANLVEGTDFTRSGATITMVGTFTGWRAVITYRTAADLALVKFTGFLGTSAGERDTELEADSSASGLVFEDDDLPAASGNVVFPRAVQSIQSFKVGAVTLTQGVDYGFTSGASTLEMFTSIYEGMKGTITFTAEGGQWLSTDTGNEIARFKMKAEFNEEAFASGINDISARVRGRQLFDPRNSTTSYSRNPALAIRAWMLNHPKLQGIEINETSIEEAADVCDQPVDLDAGGSTTQPRYTLDGPVYDDQAPWSTLSALLTSMNGFAFKSGGEWYLRAGAYRASSMDLYDADMSDGPVEVQTAVERAERFNAVRGQYSDPNNLNLPNDYPPYRSATYLEDDGDLEQFEDIDLPFTDDPIRAQRIAKQMLHLSRQAVTETAQWSMKAYPLQPGDTVTRYSDLNGWEDGKTFRVVERAFNFATYSVQLTLQETAAALYDWSYDEATDPDPAPNSNLPDPGYVEPPVNLTIETSATSFETLPDGTRIPYAIVTFDPVTDSSVLRGGKTVIKWKRAVEFEWRTVEIRGGQTALDPRVKLEPISGGDTINVFAYNLNSSGVESEKRFASHVANSSLPSNGSNIMGAVANHVQNSSMDFIQTDWRIALANFYPPIGAVPAMLHAPPQNINDKTSPNPGRVYAPADGPTQNFEVWVPNDISVEPGQWVYARVKALVARFDARINLRFLDSAGTYLAAVAGGSVFSVGPTLGDMTDKAAYKTLEMTYQAPEDAATVRMSMELTHANAGPSDRATFAWLEPQVNVLDRPLLGTERPKYQPGPAGNIGVNQIVIGGVTYVDAEYIESKEIYTANTQSIHLIGTVAAVSDVDNADGVIRVTGSFNINFVNNTGYAMVIITEQALTQWPSSQNKWIIARNLDDTHPTAVGTFIKEQRFKMNKGQKTFLVYGCAGGVQITNGSCVLYGVTIGAEVIKR